MQYADIDVYKEINKLQTRILLMCAFGVDDLADREVDYWKNGTLQKKTVGESLDSTFQALIQRVASPHIQVFPFLANWFITSKERDM